MDWAEVLTDRYISTPAIRWIENNQLGLRIDGKDLNYSHHHYDLSALIGRSIKRGQDIGLFVPRLSDADIAFILTYHYAIWFDVRVGLSLPGHWANRHIFNSNPHLMVIGNGPKMRQLLVNRTTFGRQPLHDYMGIYWPSRKRKQNDGKLFDGEGNADSIALYIVPQSKVTEDNFLYYSEVIHPFVIFFDLTSKVYTQKQIKSQIAVCKTVFPNTPIIVLAATGNISAMKILRDAGISTWVMRANDIQRLDKHRKPDVKECNTGLCINSQTLQAGITVNIQLVNDETMDQWLVGLIGVLHQIDKEIKKDNSGEDKSLYYEAATILSEVDPVTDTVNQHL